MKSRIHQLVDAVDDETLLEEASRVLSGQGIPFAEYKEKMKLATLTDLTNQQLKQLEQAIAEHKEGKTLSHEVIRENHRKRFPTANI